MQDDAPIDYAARTTASVRTTSAHVDSLGTIACVFLALVTIGFAAFRFLPGALPTGASHNADRTFFSSVNAVTLTGFEQSFASVPNFPTAGKTLLALLALGGALATILGSTHFLRAITNGSQRSRTLVIGSAAIVLVPTIVGAITAGFDGVFAATRLGLLTRADVGGGTLAWLVALAVPAVVGPAIWLLRRGDAVRPIAATLLVAAIVYVASTLLLASTADDWRRSASATGAANQIARQLNVGSTLSVDASVGVGINAAWSSRAGATPWVLIGLMTIGTVPGGLGAGVGLLPLVLIGRRACGWVSVDAVESSLLAPAIASVAGWLVVAFSTLVVLASTQPGAPGDRLLFVVVSAMSNVGLSHDPIDLTSRGLFALSLAMLAGRLLPIAMLCAMAIAADRVRSSHA